jgi:hypothetical protein
MVQFAVPGREEIDPTIKIEASPATPPKLN